MENELTKKHLIVVIKGQAFSKINLKANA